MEDSDEKKVKFVVAKSSMTLNIVKEFCNGDMGLMLLVFGSAFTSLGMHVYGGEKFKRILDAIKEQVDELEEEELGTSK